MKLSKTNQVIIEAFEKGYRVTEDGKLIGLKGEIKVCLRGKQKYPFFSVSTKLTKSQVYGLPVHRFAAYCFYGNLCFEDGTVCRHLNGNVLDFSKNNLVLGTHSENNLDKDPEVRIKAAKAARASQGKKPHNTKITDEMLEEIYKLPAKNGRIVKGEAKKLADKFGVAKSTVAMAFRRETHNE